MKFSSTEEYGLRCLLRIAHSKSVNGLTIPEISRIEELTQAYAAKLLRLLRIGGFIESARGQSGGYKLAYPPNQIIVGDVLNALGGKFFESSFCKDFPGINDICTHTIDCSVRSLWKAVQKSVDSVLQKTTLNDLMGEESKVNFIINNLTKDKFELISEPK